MNYIKAQELFIQSQTSVENKQYIEALNILMKISSAFQYYKSPPFTPDDLTQLASKCCDELKSMDALKDDVWTGYGIILRNSGQLEESVTVFDSVLDRTFNKDTLLEKACTLEVMGDTDSALDLLKEGLKEFPYEKMILNNIATLYEQEEDWDMALNYYNLALDIDVKGGISYYNKGRILFILEDYQQAQLHFQTALDLYDKNDFRIVDVYVFLGDCHYQLKQFQRAKEIYEQVIDLFPQRGEGYYGMAEFYYNIGHFSKALRYINKAMALSPRQAEYYFKKAYLQNRLNQKPKAIKTLQEGVRYFPNDCLLLDLMGEIYVSVAKYRSAIKAFKKRLDQETDIDIVFYVAKCYFQLEDYLNSLSWINQYIQSSEFDAEAYILRAKINSITGYFHLALNDLKSVVDLDDAEFYFQDNDWYYLEKLLEIEECKELLKKVGQ